MPDVLSDTAFSDLTLMGDNGYLAVLVRALWTFAAMHLVVDVHAYFTPGSFEDIADVRLADTRID